jgi:hypothetical protein
MANVFKGALGGRRRMSMIPKDVITSNSLLAGDESFSNSNNPPKSDKTESLEGLSTSAGVVGLVVENITPCFVSKHVKALCDTSCWATWKESVDNFEIAPFQSVQEIFATKMETLTGEEMKPSRNEQFAAVVMADVSGYSKLSSSLAGRGAEGAEILCRTMKGYLDKVNREKLS